MEVRSQIHIPADLPPLNRRLGGLQNLSGRLGEEKKILSQPGIEPRTVHTIHSLEIYKMPLEKM
jgi:hypothetical protein